MAFVTRFAPSPTGPLHLGHAYSAMLAHDMARAAGGVLLLRIEDTDLSRVSRAHEAQICDDLRWLGLDWPQPVLRQSEHLAHYGDVLASLGARALTYPCSCSRGDIRAALSAPQEGAAAEMPDGPIYPGTCRGRPLADHRPGDAIRIDLRKAADAVAAPLAFSETGLEPRMVRDAPEALVERVGDVVLGRRGDGAVAYHLACVIDDARQNVTHVIRGHDLAEATMLHVLLQRLLGLPTPIYHHHRLIRDDHGKRLAKRDDARALAKYRAEGATPADIRRMVGLKENTRKK